MTFFQDFKRDDGLDVTVQYCYEDHGTVVCIMECWSTQEGEKSEDPPLIELTDAEHERIAVWIMKHRSGDDQAPGDEM
jgi:hypothetical protein